jgi:hypothetical protein
MSAKGVRQAAINASWRAGSLAVHQSKCHFRLLNCLCIRRRVYKATCQFTSFNISTLFFMSSRPASPAFTDADSLTDVDSLSKREYLLAQIRQKDAIIESLLKQVRISLEDASPF